MKCLKCGVGSCSIRNTEYGAIVFTCQECGHLWIEGKHVHPNIIYFYEWATILILAMLIYGEAVGEPKLGKTAVAWVVKNRVESNRKEFGWHGRVNWTSVMLEPKSFSCFNAENVNREKLIDLILNPADPRQYYANQCMEIAQAVYDGELKDPTDGALFYVNKRLAGKMKWMKKLEKTIVIGRHVFYKYKESK